MYMLDNVEMSVAAEREAKKQKHLMIQGQIRVVYIFMMGRKKKRKRNL